MRNLLDLGWDIILVIILIIAVIALARFLIAWVNGDDTTEGEGEL